ncbi:MAG TPA: ATPase domain-containing protein [Thermoanaerobaculia bacterium]|nr:ATPase domain-containing protein [Thermoanaerobaculia bacterium]
MRETTVLLERIRTGIPELDDVLTGGLPANSINVLMGLPGTGKTILAEQIAFANATSARPALFLSTLSEPLEKFIAHGQTFDFFDASKVGREVYYEDLGLAIRERGLSALPDVVAALVAERRPRIIVIDSFKALGSVNGGGPDRRQVLFDLASMLATFECTTFLVGEYSQESIADLPEFAIADAVLQLLKHQSGMREERFLRIEKLRGSDSVPGLHAFRIGAAGISVFPRLLTPKLTPSYNDRAERMSTGIPGLDAMVEQGFWRGSTTLVAGPSGAGKTALSLHFIHAGVETEERGLYVGFQENPVQLARALANFGWDPKPLLSGGNFEHMYHSPVEMQLDQVVIDLFRRVRQRKIRRVVIDALGDLRRSSFDRQRFTEYMYSLTQWFAVEGVTAILTLETSDLFETHRLSDEEISNMSDNILLLRLTRAQPMERTMSIIKTRNSAHDHAERVLRITSRGVAVEEATRQTAN